MTEPVRPANPSLREIPVPAGSDVDLRLGSNRLNIRTGRDGVVVVRARGGEDLDRELEVITGHGYLKVIDGGAGTFRLGPLSLRTGHAPDLDVEIPRDVRLSVRTISGDVNAAGITGPSRWTTAAGDLRLALDGGPVTVETMSGDARIEATVPLAVTARTVSGDVRVRAPRVLVLDAATTSGDVEIDAALADASAHTVTSVSGDVRLITGSEVRVEMQSVAGDVKASMPHRTEGSRGRRTVIVGSGRVHVAVRTMSGDVRLRQGQPDNAPPAPAVPFAPPVPAAPLVPVAPPCPSPPRPRPPSPRGPRPPGGAWMLPRRRPPPWLRPRSPQPPPTSPRLPPTPSQTPFPPPTPRPRPSSRSRARPRRPPGWRTSAWGSSAPSSAASWTSRPRGSASTPWSRRSPRPRRAGDVMTEDPLDHVIRLVAEGRLTADEATPILAALDERSGATAGARTDRERAGGTGGPRQGPSGHGPAAGTPAGQPAEARDPDATRSLRIEVRDRDRTVVNLRLPLAVGRYALDRVPGLSGDQVARVREALSSGMTGPVLAVDDESGSVRIVIE